MDELENITDTDCRKCKAPMRSLEPHTVRGWLAHAPMKITGYLCEKCGHWNNLKRRKPK